LPLFDPSNFGYATALMLVLTIIVTTLHSHDFTDNFGSNHLNGKTYPYIKVSGTKLDMRQQQRTVYALYVAA